MSAYCGPWHILGECPVCGGRILPGPDFSWVDSGEGYEEEVYCGSYCEMCGWTPDSADEEDEDA